MKSLPIFKTRPRDQVLAFMTRVLTLDPASVRSFLRELIEYPDGHYRALFDPAYFVTRLEQSEPSKSQWNNLKKRMKRHDPQVFVFKEHGKVAAGDGSHCYYVDFGFFAG